MDLDFRNLTVDQEVILQSILKTCKYLNFATTHKVSESILVEQARELGYQFRRLEQLAEKTV